VLHAQTFGYGPSPLRLERIALSKMNRSRCID
jgi:hypothetical protein